MRIYESKFSDDPPKTIFSFSNDWTNKILEIDRSMDV